MAQPTKPVVSSVWASTAPDNVTPTDAFIAAGWPQSTTPPSRGRFNWLLNYLYNGVRYFSRRGIADYDAAETYMTNDKTMGPDGLTYISLVDNNTANTPASSPTQWARWGLAASEKGIVTFTASGTFTATYTGTHFVSGTAAGGSGGGGGSNNISNAAGACGSGAGYGQNVWRMAFNLVKGTTYTITIGTGGASVAGAAQGMATALNGNPGGNTVFSGSGITTLTLVGGGAGQGGSQGASSGNVPGPSGGSGFPAGGSSADGLNAGVGVSAYAAVGGAGASGPFGGGGFGGRAGQGGGVAATPGYGYGSGGAGGGSAYGSGGGGGASSAGMNGYFCIEW